MTSIPPGADLCAVPAAPLPDGRTMPNFTDPVSLATTTIAVSAVLIALTFTFVGARTWANRHKLKWSDYFAIVALIFHTANVGIVISCIAWFAVRKYNRHQWDVPVCWYDAGYLKRLYVQVITFGMTLLVSKAAIFLLYLEIFGVKIGLCIAVYIGLIFNAILYLSFIPMASYFGAPHAGRSWESMLTTTEGLALLPWGIVIGAGSVLLDAYILILPLPIIYHLTISTSKRLQLVAVFGTALMGVTASLVALGYRVKLLNGVEDSTWNQAVVAIASIAENSIALIVGSAPAFSSFFRTHVAESGAWKSIRSRFWSTFGSSKGSQGHSRPSFPRPLRTFGSTRSPFRSQRKEGFEPTDTELLNSTATAQYNRLHDETEIGGQNDQGHGSIVRTVPIFQQTYKHPESSDRLV
ncbi:hypothetical protein DL767_008145 [Monosporascus sp. MG133]|nr:hypothetical protein DL767_008145 [Monosporascus sp. MG133]